MAGAGGMLRTAFIYWPAIFACFTAIIMLVLDPTPKEMWPPTLDLSGKQAKQVLTSPWFLGSVIPLALGLLGVKRLVQSAGFSADEHASMVWWLCNLVWFHTACDLLSGFWQVMPVLTQLYARMSPSHHEPRWHEARAHMDAGYALEALVEVPMAAWVLWMFIWRDPGRHVAEVFACAVQFAGTVAYYAPGLAKGEAACWLSWLDRSCGAVWLIYPAFLLHRHLRRAREAKLGKGQ